jgi:hypothetical protein
MRLTLAAPVAINGTLENVTVVFVLLVVPTAPW